MQQCFLFEFNNQRKLTFHQSCLGNNILSVISNMRGAWLGSSYICEAVKCWHCQCSNTTAGNGRTGALHPHRHKSTMTHKHWTPSWLPLGQIFPCLQDHCGIWAALASKTCDIYLESKAGSALPHHMFWSVI